MAGPPTLFFFGLLQCGDGTARQLDLDVLRYSELDAVIFESHYRTVNPTRRDDLIARFQVVDHLLKPLSLALRRQEYDQVEDAEDNEKEKRSRVCWRRLGLLLKKH